MMSEGRCHCGTALTADADWLSREYGHEKMSSRTNNVYESLDAELHFRVNSSIDFETVHKHALHLLPQVGSNVIDIGAGCGRDAKALAARGYRVVAVEPWDAMRALAETQNHHSNITWVDDCLPHLRQVRRMNRIFEFVLVQAVWMHLSRNERKAGLLALRAIVHEGSSVVITLRQPPDVARGMHDVDPIELLNDAALHGFSRRLSFVQADALGRPGVSWCAVHLGL